MESDGEVGAFLAVFHVAGMEGVAVAEQALSLGQDIALVVDMVLDGAGHDPGKLNFRVPVPQKRALFVGLDSLDADLHGKAVVSVFLDLLLVFFNVNLRFFHKL